MSQPSPGNELLEAALGYAARGWRVVPLRERDKGPWVDDWPTAASAAAATVRGWWAERPASNVGVALGPDSGLVAIDIDTEEAGRVLAELAGDDLPDTLEMTTGKGSRLLFAIPAGLAVEPKTRVVKGADKKEAFRYQSRGGQCVMPPSVHPNGKRYAWVEGRSPADLAPAPMPAWLVREMCPEPPAAPAVRPPAAPVDGDAVRKRAVAYLSKCSLSVSGALGHNDLFWAARVLVHGFALPEHEAAAILHTYFNPQCKPPWPAKDVERKVREAAERPFDKPKGWLRDAAGPPLRPAGGDPGGEHERPPSRRGEPAPDAKPWEAPPRAARPAAGSSAAELVCRDFPPPRWAVADLLPEGLTVLGGRPKQGKSWLALLIATAVAAGHELDGRAVPGGDVLYLALEDTERRLKARLLTLRGGVAWPVPERLTVTTRWPRSEDGGLYFVAEWLAAHPAARLVIVDTLAKFRTPPKGTANSYAEDYQAIGGLKELLDQFGVSGLVVHHTRKLKAEDPFDELSGTQAISGAADSIWVLDRARGATDARLFVTGRDVADGTVPLTFQTEFCRWHLGAAVEGIDVDGRVAPAVKTVDQCVAWLKEFLAEFAWPSKEIEDAAKKAGFAFTTVRDAKARLGSRGTGEATHKNFGAGEGNGWWSGLGPASGWTFRPGPRPAEADPGWSGANSRRSRRDIDGRDDGGF